MASRENEPFRVIFSQRILDQLDGWATKAKRLGLYRPYLQALKTIQDKLAAEPLEWGDPQYRLRGLRLLVCHILHEMFQVYYGVEEQRHIVFVKEIRLVPHHPLAQEE